MKIILHQNDLPADIELGKCVAVDTETLGLNVHRDALCLVQLSAGDGTCHLVKFDLKKPYKAKNLAALLEDKAILKIFHYARFDVATLNHYLNVNVANIYCTKIASKLSRTYTDKHGLKDLCGSMLDIEISKEVRTSNWSADVLTEAQQAYAATDVLYLHELKDQLDSLLKSTGRLAIAQHCFDFIPTLVSLDLMGWDGPQIFAHK